MWQQTLRMLSAGDAASRRAPLVTARRGSGLIDGLVALAILAFGMLAMTRFQGRMVAQMTEAQSRQVASQFGSELLATVIVDAPNAACYTLPQVGTCGNAAAKVRAADWQTRLAAVLPGSVTSTATLDAGTGRLTVVVGWSGKDSGEARRLEVATDVR